MRAPRPALAVAVPGLSTELSVPIAGSCAESQPPGIPAGAAAAAGHGVTVLPGRERGWGCAQALPSLLPCSPQPGPKARAMLGHLVAFRCLEFCSDNKSLLVSNNCFCTCIHQCQGTSGSFSKCVPTPTFPTPFLHPKTLPLL